MVVDVNVHNRLSAATLADLSILPHSQSNLCLVWLPSQTTLLVRIQTCQRQVNSISFFRSINSGGSDIGSKMLHKKSDIRMSLVSTSMTSATPYSVKNNYYVQQLSCSHHRVYDTLQRSVRSIPRRTLRLHAVSTMRPAHPKLREVYSAQQVWW